MSDSPPPVETEKKKPKRKRAEKPWVAIATGLIAVSAPITASVYTSASKEKELQITAATKDKELQIAAQEKQYLALDRAVDSKLEPASRRLVLRFLANVPEDKRLRDWAQQELEDLEGKLAEAKKHIAELETQNSKAASEVDRLASALVDARARVEKSRADSVAVRDAARVQLSSIQEKLRRAEEKQAKAAAELVAVQGKQTDPAQPKQLSRTYWRFGQDFDPNIHCVTGSVSFGCAYYGKLRAETGGGGLQAWAEHGKYHWTVSYDKTRADCECDASKNSPAMQP